MSIHLILTLVTLLVVVIMFLSGKFNFGWIGMFCATFLCATGVLSFKDAYANFASTNVVMVSAMFILAGALGKTTLVDHVRNWIMSKGTSGRSIVFLYLLGSILLTQLVSPLGVIAMLLPLTAALDENSPVQPSQLLYPGAVCSHASQAMLPVGAGLTYFVTANALMEANGAEQRFTMFDKSAVVFVPALVAFLYMAFIGWKHFPVIKIDAAKIDESRAGKAKKIDPKTEKVIYIVFILTMIAICFNSYLPFPMYIIPIIADLILGALGCINMKEAKQYVNFETILMLAGLLCLATAMQQTGAADLVAEFIVKALGGNPSPLAIMIAFLCRRRDPDPDHEQHGDLQRPDPAGHHHLCEPRCGSPRCRPCHLLRYHRRNADPHVFSLDRHRLRRGRLQDQGRLPCLPAAVVPVWHHRHHYGKSPIPHGIIPV